MVFLKLLQKQNIIPSLDTHSPKENTDKVEKVEKRAIKIYVRDEKILYCLCKRSLRPFKTIHLVGRF